MSEIRPYRPSNGTEGEIFQAQWCDRCERDRAYRENTDAGDPCTILTLTFALGIDEPDYPKEWVQDRATGPHCTAFQPIGRDAPFDPDAAIGVLL